MANLDDDVRRWEAHLEKVFRQPPESPDRVRMREFLRLFLKDRPPSDSDFTAQLRNANNPQQGGPI